MSTPSLSTVLDAMERMDRAEIAQALRDYMNAHKVSVSAVSRELNVPRVLIRDLLMDRVTPEVPRHGAYKTMTHTLIREGQVYVTPWTDDEASLDAFGVMRQYHLDYGTKDVYMSLENVNGVTIRQFELRNGRIHRDWDGATAVREESYSI